MTEPSFSRAAARLYGPLVLLCAFAATTKSPRYHAFFAVFFLIYNLAMLSTNLLRLM